MLESSLRQIKLSGLLFVRYLHRARGTWLRVLLCWAIGLTIGFLDSNAKFDSRFKLRNQQSDFSRYIIVYLNQGEWTDLSHQDRNLLRPLKEVSAFTDSFYWNESAWNRLLKSILAAKPASIAVTFFFPVNAIGGMPSPTKYPSFFHPKVFWAARLDNDGRVALPAFTSSYGLNAGLVDFFADDDSVVRRFYSPLVQVPHLSLRLGKTLVNDEIIAPWSPGRHTIINYLAPPNSIRSVSAAELFFNPESVRGLFKDKVVLIGTREIETHLVNTPFGPMPRAEVLAQMSENLTDNRWIQRLPFPLTGIYLLLLIVLVVAALRVYPHAVAFLFLFWLGLGITALSLFLFDVFNFWLPILSPLATLVVSYMVFLGFQLARQENLNWRLEQEKKYLQEIEQLKNNFVSLFSHDLKTPIAKIQAICDRLLPQAHDGEIQTGLQSLRQESSELHRYIQSILRMSRVESQDFRLFKEPTDINELIFKVCQQLKPLAEARQIVLDTNLEPIFAIEIDSNLMQEVILNLIENAIKYTPAGGTVKISSQETDDDVIVTVEDNGPGIAPEVQNRIFEKFFRGPDHTHSTKGSGLGLYLVKYFVELHGGQVFIRSQLNKGTRVGFSLPLTEAPLTLTEKSHDRQLFENLDS